MPELPEVETICNGIRPHLCDKTFQQVIVRERQLRWLIPEDLAACLIGEQIVEIKRRGKYCLIQTRNGTLMIHLGMSGSLRIVPITQPITKHDHVDFIFDAQTVLRFNDPRKFGAVLWTTEPIEKHKLICDLGVEPLTDAFTADYFYQLSRHRKKTIKVFIMDGHIVVGVGNIYASESLFAAKISPLRHAGELSLIECQLLVAAIRTILQRAIMQGGTTLKDFVNEQGKPGYFKQSLAVYGRTGEACYECQQPIQSIILGQRASYFCPRCQI